eukprot:12900341-Prorocentrum_lima.AAC.1
MLCGAPLYCHWASPRRSSLHGITSYGTGSYTVRRGVSQRNEANIRGSSSGSSGNSSRTSGGGGV